MKVLTPERWRSLIKHVEVEIEDHYWEADGLNEEEICYYQQQ